MDIRKALKPEEPRICEICNADFSKYVCPKCGVPYCSLVCYKDANKHLKCSESFYRDCVVESMKEMKADQEQEEAGSSQSQSTSKGPTCKEMKEMLERIENNQEEVNNILYNGDDDDESSEESSDSTLDSDDEASLKKRMEGVNLDDADTVWNKLTLEEKKGFQKFVTEYKEKYQIDDIEED